MESNGASPMLASLKSMQDLSQRLLSALPVLHWDRSIKPVACVSISLAEVYGEVRDMLRAEGLQKHIEGVGSEWEW